MNKIIALYSTPVDRAEFDRHYRDVHAPLCLKLPHLKGFEVSRGPVDADGNYHQLVVLSFDNEADLTASLASTEGRTAVADLENFASAGVQILTVEMASLL